MFVTVDLEKNKITETRQSYHVEKQGAWISEYESEEEELPFAMEDDAPLDTNWYGTAETDKELQEEELELQPGEVYMSVPRGKMNTKMSVQQVNSADRTIPSTHTVRKEVFDGVHIPRREKPPPSNVTEIKQVPNEMPKRSGTDKSSHAPRDLLPELHPIDVRVPRKEVSIEIVVDEPEPKPRKSEKNPTSQNGIIRPKEVKAVPESEESVGKIGRRQSDVQNTVSIPSIIN